MNLPNWITLGRIFLVPLLVAILLQEGWKIQLFSYQINNHALALVVFLASAATDMLDGYLARRWGQITTVGTLMDPIADKLLISAALIVLVQMRAVPAWAVIVIIGREFVISGLRAIAASEGYAIGATELAKTKMLAQVIAVAFLILSLETPAALLPALICLYAMVFISLWSAVDYFRKFWRKLDDSVKLRRRKELLALERQRARQARKGARGSLTP